MNTEPMTNRCPKCQALLPAEAPQGLCPKCLLAAVSTPTEAGQPASARTTPPTLEVVAAAFPQLEIIELVGHGGMGMVYKARQPRLDRFVALKLLPQSFASDPAFAERFNREARVLARLNHPNIVTVHDFGQSGGFCYLLMEFVDGVNLRQAMQAGRFTPQQALLLVPKICEALQYAHDEGILHRDIKPENILLAARGRVKIADFGIAKLLGDRSQDVTLTASGATLGTPHYMAPEQIEHPQDVDQRADIYSLGVVFYEMLTGELPIGRFAPPSAKSAVDARVDDVVFRALEKEREKRFGSAGEVKTSVEAITANPANPATPVAPVAAPATLPINPEVKPLVLLALAIGFGMLAVQLIPMTGMVLGTFFGLVHTSFLGAFWAVLTAGASSWLVWMVWQHRQRLLEPLGIQPTDTFQFRSPDGTWSTDGLLGVAAVAVLLGLTLQIAVQLFFALTSLLNPGWIGGRWLAWVMIVGAAVAGWKFTHHDQQPSAVVPPGAPPPWLKGVTTLFLAMGAVAFFPALFMQGQTQPHFLVGLALAVTGLALLTRNATWRRAALILDAASLVLGATQLAGWGGFFMSRAWPLGLNLPVPGPNHAVFFLGLLVLLTLACIASLVVLCHPEVKGCFGGAGVGPATTPSPRPPACSTATGPSGTVILTGKGHWSMGTIVAAVLVAFSLLPLVPLLLAGGTGNLHLGPKELLVLLFFPGSCALVGTALGAVKVAEIRRAAGQLRGLGLALFAALAWPLLFLDGVLGVGFLIVIRLFADGYGPAVRLAIWPFVGLALIGLLAVDIIIAWAMTCWAHRPLAVPLKPPRRRSSNALAIVLVLVIVALGLAVLPLTVLFLWPLTAMRTSYQSSGQEQAPITVSTAVSPAPSELKPSAQATLISVPAGHVLTVMATVWSNQVALPRIEPDWAGYVIAPVAHGVVSELRWRLSDPASLNLESAFEVSLRAGDTGNVVFNHVLAEPLAGEWIARAVAREIWLQPGSRSNWVIAAGQVRATDHEPPALVEWKVGLEARLEALPAGRSSLSTEAQVGPGSDWRSALENPIPVEVEGNGLAPPERSP